MTPVTPTNWDHLEISSGKWMVDFNCPGNGCGARWKISDRKIDDTGNLMNSDGGGYHCALCGFESEIMFAGFARQGPPR